jgi:hypothetical protein
MIDYQTKLDISGLKHRLRKLEEYVRALDRKIEKCSDEVNREHREARAGYPGFD